MKKLFLFLINFTTLCGTKNDANSTCDDAYPPSYEEATRKKTDTSDHRDTF